jgi:hypothetical protein
MTHRSLLNVVTLMCSLTALLSANSSAPCAKHIQPKLHHHRARRATHCGRIGDTVSVGRNRSHSWTL